MRRGPLKCPECSALFYSKEDLDAHMSAWHRPGGLYYLKCPKCGKVFEDRRRLEEHLHRHPEEAGEEHVTLLTEYEE